MIERTVVHDNCPSCGTFSVADTMLASIRARETLTKWPTKWRGWRGTGAEPGHATDIGDDPYENLAAAIMYGNWRQGPISRLRPENVQLPLLVVRRVG